MQGCNLFAMAIGTSEYLSTRSAEREQFWFEQGLQRAIATTGNNTKLLMFKDNRTPESIADAYEIAFKRKDRPTAMVLTSSNHLLTSLSWLVSKASEYQTMSRWLFLPNDTWYSEFYPPLCHYKLNTKSFSHAIAERVLELIEYGRIILKPLAMPVEFVPGATIGSAPVLKNLIESCDNIKSVSLAKLDASFNVMRNPWPFKRSQYSAVSITTYQRLS